MPGRNSAHLTCCVSQFVFQIGTFVVSTTNSTPNTIRIIIGFCTIQLKQSGKHPSLDYPKMLSPTS